MSELLSKYLLDAITAEKAFEERLLAFSRQGDDEEVQATFAEHARETSLQREKLQARLTALGGSESQGKSAAAEFLSLAPSIPDVGHSPEEQLVQNLITAYTVETGECAMYQALAIAAQTAGDVATEALAREIQAEEVRAAEKIFRFLPTRSKIAFNVLTAGELDPAVETKVGIL
jgi:ferritin-like metal-binding protein YciE